ncbi:putative cyclin-D6-1 isoform X2 [Mangifera indica]|uniref:putative cyclin-D6-1 isoform X2 n=1 Tax=Mangifera indica TaxID=29780 RepID=UPI001CFC361D|nr:putative cyclin-D6-1 isoform X2 [Mangifera indica]
MQRIPGRIKKRERVKFKSLLIKKSHHHSSTFSLSTASNQFYHHYICLSRTECICSSTHQLIFHSLTQMEFNLEYPFTNFQDLVLDDDTENLSSLFLVESDHMPSEDYIKSLKSTSSDFSLRQQAVSLIFQFSCGFDPFLSYLASNYMDRFLSSQVMPQPDPRMLQLLAISCLSLAAKMRKMEFTLTHFRGDAGLIFDTQTIERMEYVILGALNWRMRSVTPFSFLSFFISLFNLKDPPLKHALKARAGEIIFKSQSDIEILEFKPSIIAASALLFASRELFPMQFHCFRKAISNSSYEKTLECFNCIEEIVMDGYESAFETVSSSDTPVNELDRRFSSAESDKTLGSTATNAQQRLERVAKRRKKMNGFCDNHQPSTDATDFYN